MDAEKTVVIFRVWPDGQTMALFPEDPSDVAGYFCSSYMHLGQHSGADYQGCVKATRPATPEEYADLKAELEGIGYNLDVKRRATRAMDDKRRDVART
jgi:hypothetical protein